MVERNSILPIRSLMGITGPPVFFLSLSRWTRMQVPYLPTYLFYLLIPPALIDEKPNLITILPPRESVNQSVDQYVASLLLTSIFVSRPT